MLERTNRATLRGSFRAVARQGSPHVSMRRHVLKALSSQVEGEVGFTRGEDKVGAKTEMH